MGSRRSESVSTSSTPTASPAADATSTPSSTSLALPSRNRSSSPPQRRHPARRRRQPVVLLPHERGKISAKTRPRAVDCSASADGPVEVRPSAVTVRFAVAARDGLFTGTLGCGRFLRRKPSHFSPPGFHCVFRGPLSSRCFRVVRGFRSRSPHPCLPSPASAKATSPSASPCSPRPTPPPADSATPTANTPAAAASALSPLPRSSAGIGSSLPGCPVSIHARDGPRLPPLPPRPRPLRWVRRLRPFLRPRPRSPQTRAPCLTHPTISAPPVSLGFNSSARFPLPPLSVSIRTVRG